MENNLDKFFKDKFEERTFEMEPQFWEAAEALIEADERRRDWRRFLPFFILIGILFLVGGIWFFQNQEMVNNEVLDSVNNSIGKENTTQKENNSEGANDELAVINSSDILSKETENIQETDAKNTQSDNTVQSLTANKELPNQSNNNNEVNNNSIIGKQEISNPSNIPPVKTEGSKTILEGINDNRFGNTIPKTKNDIQEEKVLDIPTVETPTEVLNKKITSLDVAPPIAMMGFLPSMVTFLDKKENTKNLGVSPCFKPKRFSLGVTAGFDGYPFIDNSDINPFIGGKIGLAAEYLLQRNWSVHSELLYHYRSGNFSNIKESKSVMYAFGRSVQTKQLTPTNLHYLELPLMVKYRRKRMNFEGGLSANYLFAARGKITYPDSDTGSVSSVIDPTGFKKYYVDGLLGMNYYLNPKLTIGVRANYAFGGILDKSVELPNNQEALRESGPMYLTFKVTQFLF